MFLVTPVLAGYETVCDYRTETIKTYHSSCTYFTYENLNIEDFTSSYSEQSGYRKCEATTTRYGYEFTLIGERYSTTTETKQVAYNCRTEWVDEDDDFICDGTIICP